ncbi:MAG: phosphoribosylformylglycinamidine synthase subunit PurL [Brevinematales bacterium]|nr:phosphoribosylformylglycinamidine synthase subunit PurL [Brevinematales bacterium]
MSTEVKPIEENVKKQLEVLNLSLEEYEMIINYLGRKPNEVELGMFGALWSEHCGYKHTRKLLKELPTEGKYIYQGPGENAGVIKVDDIAIVFKIESHNHPSAVEPYQGAATGVGGIVRDILAMGARPIALLDSLRFGNPSKPEVRYTIEGVVKGISDYGNCIGVPTVAGEVYFEDAYEKNPLVNVMCVGITKIDNLVKSVAKGIGNLVVYYGAKTGRDGVHGATFASAELDTSSKEDKSSIQIADPFVEKKLIEATLELAEKKLVVAIQDMGAAGLTSSSCEMASKGGVGIELNLEKVPVRVSDITPYEIMLSESQERMLAIVEPSKLEEVSKILQKWELDWAVIGKITNTKHCVIKYKDKVIADLPLKYLVEEVPFYLKPSKEDPEVRRIRDIKPTVNIEDYKSTILKLISSPNISSKKWIYEQYDWSVQTNTVIPPGKAGASVIRIKGTNKGIAIKVDGNGRYMYSHPYIGAMVAVAESARNVSFVGAEPAGITNCLNFGSPDNENVSHQIQQGIKGVAKACKELNIPVTGGNASLYNEYENKPIYPTITIGCVGIIDDISKIVDSEFKKPGDLIALIGNETKEDFGMAEILKVLDKELCGKPPIIEFEVEKKLQEFARFVIKHGLISSANDLSEGGLIVSIIESMVDTELGAAIDLSSLPVYPTIALFSETQSRGIFSFDPEFLDTIKTISHHYNLKFRVIGEVIKENKLIIKGFKNQESIIITKEELKNAYYSNNF